MIVWRTVAMNLLPLVLHRDRRAMSTPQPPTGFLQFSQANATPSRSQQACLRRDGYATSRPPRLKNAAASDQSP
jgi:hypothetical protein